MLNSLTLDDKKVTNWESTGKTKPFGTNFVYQILVNLYIVFKLNLIWVGSLVVCFEVRGGKITLCLKRVRIVLQTWNLFRKYTHKFSSRKCIFTTKAFLTLLMSDFIFYKKSAVFEKSSTFTQSNSLKVVLEIF